MATADYLNQLIADRNTLANNLHEIDGTSSTSETFTQLVPKVANIKTAIQGLNVVNTTQESTALTITDGKEAQINKIDVLGRTEQKTTTGKNFFNANLLTSPIIVEDLGKTIKLPIDTAGIGYLNTLKTLKQVCPNLNVGDTAYLYFNRNLGYQEYNSRIYCDSAQVAWQVGTNKIITQAMLDSNVVMYANRYIAGETQQCILTDFRIVKNENEPYEPYTGGKPSPNPDYQSPIENVRGSTVDNTINFSVEGKNKYDSDAQIADIRYNDSGDIVSDTSVNSSDFINVKPNTIYILSGTTNKGGGIQRFNFFDYNKNWLSVEKYTFPSGNYSHIFTIPNNATYVRTSQFKEVVNLQIEQGTISTPYEPYHLQTVTFPLGEKVLMQGSKLTDYGFYDEKRQTSIQSSQIYSFNTSYTNLNTVIINKLNNDLKYGNTVRSKTILCDKLIYSTRPNGYDDTELIGKIYDGGDSIYMIGLSKTIKSLEEAKEYIGDLLLEYELANSVNKITPYTAEQQTAYNQLKALLLHTGTNYITTDGNLPPNMKIEYKQDALEVVKNSLN